MLMNLAQQFYDSRTDVAIRNYDHVYHPITKSNYEAGVTC